MLAVTMIVPSCCARIIGSAAITLVVLALLPLVERRFNPFDAAPDAAPPIRDRDGSPERPANDVDGSTEARRGHGDDR